MRLGRFRDLARKMYEDVPPVFREGVGGLVVEPGTRGHPSLEGIFTLGECVTDFWPDGMGEGETRSHIVLWHGSFRELAARDPQFEWEEELWETILHELLHHREAAASEDGLDRFDYAVDQNFLRLAGRPFDPTFYRELAADEEGAVRLDGETFVETGAEGGEAEFPWRGHAWSVRVPDEDTVRWIRVRNLAAGRLWVIVPPRRPWWRRLLGAAPEPAFHERRALPLPPGAAAGSGR